MAAPIFILLPILIPAGVAGAIYGLATHHLTPKLPAKDVKPQGGRGHSPRGVPIEHEVVQVLSVPSGTPTSGFQTIYVPKTFTVIEREMTAASISVTTSLPPVPQPAPTDIFEYEMQHLDRKMGLFLPIPAHSGDDVVGSYDLDAINKNFVDIINNTVTDLLIHFPDNSTTQQADQRVPTLFAEPTQQNETVINLPWSMVFQLLRPDRKALMESTALNNGNVTQALVDALHRDFNLTYKPDHVSRGVPALVEALHHDHNTTLNETSGPEKKNLVDAVMLMRTNVSEGVPALFEPLRHDHNTTLNETSGPEKKNLVDAVMLMRTNVSEGVHALFEALRHDHDHDHVQLNLTQWLEMSKSFGPAEPTVDVEGMNVTEWEHVINGLGPANPDIHPSQLNATEWEHVFGGLGPAMPDSDPKEMETGTESGGGKGSLLVRRAMEVGTENGKVQGSWVLLGELGEKDEETKRKFQGMVDGASRGRMLTSHDLLWILSNSHRAGK